MNPNLTANFRAERELQAKIQQQQLASIREKLVAAKPQLGQAIDLIHSLGLAKSHFELYSNLADAYFHCEEAISQIDNHPQPDQ